MNDNDGIVVINQTDESLTLFLKKQISQGLKIPLDEIDIDAPLLEIGADSLVLMNMLNILRSKYNLNLSMIQLFEEVTTIAELVQYIKDNIVG